MEIPDSDHPTRDGLPRDTRPHGGRRTSNKVALVVLGVRRSGTSDITRILNMLGARLPRNSMPPLRGVNDSGFGESM